MSRRVILIICIFAWFGIAVTSAETVDYKTDKTYLELRDSMHHAFNDGDSLRFFPAVKKLEEYLLSKNDLHSYYTQRCNEIVFLMNRQKIYEAYMLGRQLSQELREKKLDKEMYMAYNMLGHINRYCGNKAAAKRNFSYVIELMEKYEIRAQKKEVAAPESGDDSTDTEYVYLINGKTEDQAKTDGLHYELALEIATRIETNDLSQITLSLSPETTPTGAKLDVSVVGTLSASGDLEYVVMNKVADGSTDNKQYKITLRFADTLGAVGYKWKLYDIESVMPQTQTEGSTP
jgi:hypothetical protein